MIIKYAKNEVKTKKEEKGIIGEGTQPGTPLPLHMSTVSSQFKAFSLRSETLVWVSLLRLLLRSETLAAKC